MNCGNFFSWNWNGQKIATSRLKRTKFAPLVLSLFNKVLSILQKKKRNVISILSISVHGGEKLKVFCIFGRVYQSHLLVRGHAAIHIFHEIVENQYQSCQKTFWKLGKSCGTWKWRIQWKTIIIPIVRDCFNYKKSFKRNKINTGITKNLWLINVVVVSFIIFHICWTFFILCTREIW